MVYGIVRGRVMVGDHMSKLRERAEERRRRMVVHRASAFDDAERWDLEHWKSRTPEQRLEAFMALRRDVELVLAARERDLEAGPEGGQRP